MICYLLLVVLLQQFSQITCVFEFPNVPCPDIFEYIYDGRAWYAHITVPSPNVNQVILEVNFTIQEINLSNYGKINLYNKDKVLDDIKNRRPIKYRITLPESKMLPQVTEIKYTGNIICTGPGLDPPNTQFWLMHTLNWKSSTIILPQTPNERPPLPAWTTQKPNSLPSSPDWTSQRPNTLPSRPDWFFLTPSPLSPFQNPNTIPPNNNVFDPQSTSSPFNFKNKYTNYEYCGTVRHKREIDDPDVVPFIYNGTAVPRNSHPWLAALYDTDTGALSFFCGGSLISDKHVLSAAHCTTVKKNIQVKVGAHNTNEAFELGAIIRNAISIVNHPEYSTGSAHADISIVLMSDAVNFIPTIRPICLWNIEPNLNEIIGERATIMGWGLTEQGVSSATPLQTDVTITSQQQCRKVEPLKNAISDMTFCAGTRGAGPCLGDSGGGLFLKRDGKWFLRGIISTSVANRRLQICDVNTLAVYADTAKYMDWIIDHMK